MTPGEETREAGLTRCGEPEDGLGIKTPKDVNT